MSGGPPETAEVTTRSIARMVVSLCAEEVDSDVARMVRACVLDWFGCAVGGAAEPGPQILRGVLPAGVPGGSTLVGGAREAASVDAALHNGFAAHTLELDDVHLASAQHVSAPVLAAVLAVGEEVQASPAELTLAYLGGFEAMARIGRRIGVGLVGHYHVHPTGFIGYLGAACAAARLLGLDEDGVVTAMGVAGGQAGGLTEVRGTMSKGYFAGHAAAGGVRSAQLAAAGFTSAADILGGSDGVFAAFAEAPPPVPATAPWELLHNAFKLYSSCALGHPMIDALLAVRRATGVSNPGDVERVRVRLAPESTDYLDRPRPRTGLEAKFSAQYCAAVALIDGAVGVAQFTPERVAAPGLDDLLARVELVPDRALSLGAASVTVVVGGEETSHDVRPDAGKDPVDEDQLESKFLGLTRPRLGDVTAASLAATLSRWPDVDLNAVLAIVRDPRPA